MILRRTITLLTLSVLLASCAANAERQAKRDGDRCTARGLQPESKAHDDCLTQLERARDSRMQSRHRELVEQPAATPFGR
jgi:uncharacterized protein YecT (DUF1311 family)